MTTEQAIRVGILPLRNQVPVPGAGLAVSFDRARSLEVLKALATEDDPQVALFVQHDQTVDQPGPEDVYPHGVLARASEIAAAGTTFAGLSRVRLESWADDGAALMGEVVVLGDDGEAAGTELVAELRKTARQLVEAMPELPRDLLAVIDMIPPRRLAYEVGAYMSASVENKIGLLLAESERQCVETGLSLLKQQLRLEQRLQTLAGAEMKDCWCLQKGAEAEIDRREKSGELSAEEAEDVRSFRRRGYVVFEKLVEDELIDALLSDLRSIADRPGEFLTTDHRRGRGFRLSGADFDAYESVFDLYVNFESSRRVCFHPRILRFLEIIFDARPLAFQQLLFQRSNLHPLHQDTAYVCVQEPLLLAATWVALEDVVPGRGELTYFEGSHRIPHHIFESGGKRYHSERDDEGTAREHIVRQCEEMACEQKDFFAKKGDVFLWAADLVHGSRSRTRPEHETRLSCVTHYCPETTEPVWFWSQPKHKTIERYGDRALIASSQYLLPRSPDRDRPHTRAPLPS
ncbi:MAG: LON peptidase substrate-binding domain-containing protein [Planctomycetota bacterium]